MERNCATFIYMNGLQYHKKTIQYEEWTDSIEIESFQTTKFNAHNVSRRLENAMAREGARDIRLVLKKYNPYCLERTTFSGGNDTRKMIIVADNALVVKKGSFADQRMIHTYQNYTYNHPVTVSSISYNFNMFDIFKKEEYQKIIRLFECLMDGIIDDAHLLETCSVVSNDVYIELLYALKDIMERPVSKKISLSARQKVKKLSEYID